MPGIKKTLENPPIGLQKAIISRSKGSSWDEARKEWTMKKYFYKSTGYKHCPCSPRSIANITVMLNQETNEELEICNSCAERYFNINRSSKIECVVRKAKKNEYQKIDVETGLYLLENKVIDKATFESLEIQLDDLNKDFIMALRSSVNKQLINFTDRSNKEFFDKVDEILFCAKDDSNFDIEKLLNARTAVLNGRPGSLDVFDSLPISPNVDPSTYTAEDKEEVLKFLGDYVKGYWTSFKESVLPPRKTSWFLSNEPDEEPSFFGKSKEETDEDEFDDIRLYLRSLDRRDRNFDDWD